MYPIFREVSMKLITLLSILCLFISINSMEQLQPENVQPKQEEAQTIVKEHEPLSIKNLSGEKIQPEDTELSRREKTRKRFNKLLNRLRGKN